MAKQTNKFQILTLAVKNSFSMYSLTKDFVKLNSSFTAQSQTFNVK